MANVDSAYLTGLLSVDALDSYQVRHFCLLCLLEGQVFVSPFNIVLWVKVLDLHDLNTKIM